MDHGPQRAVLADPVGEPGDALAIGDIQGERFDDGAPPVSRELLGGLDHGRLVPVDEQQHIHLMGEATSAVQPHSASGASGDTYGRHESFLPVIAPDVADGCAQYCSRCGWTPRVTSSTLGPLVLRRNAKNRPPSAPWRVASIT